MSVRGRCYCGDCTIEVRLTSVRDSFLCSCLKCQQSHSSPIVWIWNVDAKPLIAGMSQRFESETFCPRCCSQLLSENHADGASWSVFPSIFQLESLSDDSLLPAPKDVDAIVRCREATSTTSTSTTTTTSSTAAGGFEGSCRCGNVRFKTSTTQYAWSPVFCHCRECRQAVAAPFQYGAYFLTKDVEINARDEQLLVAYQSPVSPVLTRLACGRCGSRVCNRVTADFTAVFPSLLSPQFPRELLPTAMIWVNESVCRKQLAGELVQSLPLYRRDAVRDEKRNLILDKQDKDL